MLFLVRHGQTAQNARGLFLGRSDPPLSEAGERQAAALASALPTGTRLISSPLQRARQTAAAFERPVEVDERWIELDYGELDGSHPDSVTADVWTEWRRDTAYVAGGGESLAALGTRVREACDDVAEEAASGDVVVVTHVSPIKAAVAWALDVDDRVAWRMFVLDGSIARVRFDAFGPVLLGFNDVPPGG